MLACSRSCRRPRLVGLLLLLTLLSLGSAARAQVAHGGAGPRAWTAGFPAVAADLRVMARSSDAHAWGSSPNVEFLRTILGVDSAAPGFRSVAIAPHLGELTDVSGRVPHSKGVRGRRAEADWLGPRGNGHVAGGRRRQVALVRESLSSAHRPADGVGTTIAAARARRAADSPAFQLPPPRRRARALPTARLASSVPSGGRRSGR